MKIFRRIVAPVLAAVMLLALLTGCSDQVRKDKLSGKYMVVLTDSQQQVEALLKNIDAYDQEIALASRLNLYSVQLLTLTADGQYSFSYDADSTKSYVRSFYEKYFDALYDGRAALNQVYNKTFDDMSQADFQQHYATVYGYDSYTELLDALAQQAYQYDELSQPWESGTYTTQKGKLFLTPADSPKNTDSFIVYALEENTLTLTYADTTYSYTRIS